MSLPYDLSESMPEHTYLISWQTVFFAGIVCLTIILIIYLKTKIYGSKKMNKITNLKPNADWLIELEIAATIRNSNIMFAGYMLCFILSLIFFSAFIAIPIPSESNYRLEKTLFVLAIMFLGMTIMALISKRYLNTKTQILQNKQERITQCKPK